MRQSCAAYILKSSALVPCSPFTFTAFLACSLCIMATVAPPRTKPEDGRASRTGAKPANSVWLVRLPAYSSQNVHDCLEETSCLEVHQPGPSSVAAISARHTETTKNRALGCRVVPVDYPTYKVTPSRACTGPFWPVRDPEITDVDWHDTEKQLSIRWPLSDVTKRLRHGPPESHLCSICATLAE